MEEEWRDVPNYEGLYQVSNLGRVKSLDRYDSMGRLKKGKILSLGKYTNGYELVNLNCNGKQKSCQVHRLVAIVFIPNPNNKSEVDHINTDKADNRATNLRWVTRKENQNNLLTSKHLSDANRRKWKNDTYRKEQSKKISIGNSKKPIVQLNKDYSFVKEWVSARQVKKELGYYDSNISECCNGKRKTAYNYIWMNKDYYDIREQIRLNIDCEG